MAPTVMPNSETQDSTDSHVPAGNATHALVTFWASLALLGASVVFLLVYSAFKMFRNDGGRQRITHKGSKRAATARRSGRQFTQRAGTTLRPLMLGISRFGRAGHGAVSESDSGQTPLVTSEDASDTGTKAWAAAYLWHVRNIEDYAAGIPNIVQSPSPTPTPPPLYSTIYREASFGTIGIARSLDNKVRLVEPPFPPTDSEADITDIIYFYSESDCSSGSNSTYSVTNSSSGSTTLHTPDISLSKDFYPSIPAIVVDPCEDIVPPPYEEDIADQILANSEFYLKVPNPMSAKVDTVVHTSGTRKKTPKPGRQSSRSQSILSRFTEGFFRASKTKQLRVIN
ncbi:hypothetical protein EIP86_005837 [Pleurotus ostreatoroseus]|nr:hypothetical protein EIP86_005837 [Pleurotus ostreatoroseus]